jgi:hypothetical protein
VTISTVRVPRAAADADRLQAAGETAALLLQLAERQVRVADAAGAVAAVGEDDGRPVRLLPGHRRQV